MNGFFLFSWIKLSFEVSKDCLNFAKNYYELEILEKKTTRY